MDAEPIAYHCFWVLSYWIGCPRSPGTLSVTLLTSERIPPLEFRILITSLSDPARAALNDFANLHVVPAPTLLT